MMSQTNASNKIIAYILIIISILLFFLSVMLCFVEFICGVIGIIFSIATFVKGYSCLPNKSKNFQQNTTSNQSGFFIEHSDEHKAPELTFDFQTVPSQNAPKQNHAQIIKDKLHTRKIISEYNRAYDRIPYSFVAFDLETTGFSPDKDEIIQIGAIKYDNGTETSRFVSYCKPTCSIPVQAARIHHIYNSTVADAPSIQELLPQFVEFIGDYTLIAHNAPFDMKFIQTFLYDNKMAVIVNEVIDTLTISRNYLDLPNHKLPTIKDHYHLNLPSHEALSDCIVCSTLYLDYLDYINPKYDDVTDDICKCFIDDVGERIPVEMRKILEKACITKKGRCYKSPAKSAKYAIIANDLNNNGHRVTHWHNKGYKVATIEQLTKYLELT